MLSKWSRLTLTQSVLDSLPIYAFSIFKAPLKVMKEMEKIVTCEELILEQWRVPSS